MLYKYFSFNENSLSCLIHNEVWASKPTEFNDPFDSLLTIDFKSSSLQSAFESYVEKKAVCCFSKNYNNILMWSHYADNHKGFCIGIDCPELESSELVSSVNYNDVFLEVEIEEFLKSNINSEINKEWEKILTCKYIGWEYENEVRLILELNNQSVKGKKFVLNDGVIKEIYFGCRMPNQHKETIIKVLQNRNANFYHMKKSAIGFLLEII